MHENYNSKEVFLTFKIGFDEVPESVPHAEGVKLCEPMYAHPKTDSFFEFVISSSLSVSSSSESTGRPFPFDGDAYPDLGRRVPTIILQSQLVRKLTKWGKGDVPSSASRLALSCYSNRKTTL